MLDFYEYVPWRSQKQVQFRPHGARYASGRRTLTYSADGTLANESIQYIVNDAVKYTYDSLGRRQDCNSNRTVRRYNLSA
jgi:hypothetical protein